MNRRLLFLLSAMAWVAVAGSACAGLIDELDPAQRQEVEDGGQVMLQEDLPGKPWPRVRIFRIIHAKPEEVAAVFFDYNTAQTYIPDLLHSKVSKIISPSVLEVDYEVDVPILADESYTARNEIRALHGGGFCVTWTLLRALQTKGAEGNLRIEPYGCGDSLICYTNLVTPGSGMAKILKLPALARMQKTVASIAKKVETQKSSHPASLAVQLSRLREAVATQVHPEPAGSPPP